MKANADAGIMAIKFDACDCFLASDLASDVTAVHDQKMAWIYTCSHQGNQPVCVAAALQRQHQTVAGS